MRQSQSKAADEKGQSMAGNAVHTLVAQLPHSTHIPYTLITPHHITGNKLWTDKIGDQQREPNLGQWLRLYRMAVQCMASHQSITGPHSMFSDPYFWRQNRAMSK